MNRQRKLTLTIPLAVGLGLAWSWHAPSHAQTPPMAPLSGPVSPSAELMGKKIERIQFRGNRKGEDDAIRVNMATKAGTLLESQRLRADIRAMWRMGFFKNIVVEAEPTSTGGVIVTFTIEEKASIRKVLIWSLSSATRYQLPLRNSSACGSQSR